MYRMSKDTYNCDICGVEVKWDGHDEKKGTIWECERCGTHFCTDCFVKAEGQEAFDWMMKDSPRVLCPECYKKEDEDGKQSG